MANKSEFPYLHGFSKEEQDRLKQQARFAEHTIYRDIDFSKEKDILEVGSGVGAQTEILLRRFPNINLTGIDLSSKQIAEAQENLKDNPVAKGRYSFEQMNAQDMSFKSKSFDAAFLCWVLEHVPSPKKVLSEVRRVLKPGGHVVITEVLNSSFFLEPYSPNVWKYWMAFNDYQYENAGDPFVGAKLGNFLMELGFDDIDVRTKTWHFDNRFPDRRTEIIEFWTDLLMSAKEQLIKDNVISVEIAENAYKELKAVAKDPNAVFFYSFVQAQARVY